MSANEKRLFKL